LSVENLLPAENRRSLARNSSIESASVQSDTSKLSFIVEIPEGAKAGYSMLVTSPISGNFVKAIVPEGMMPGDRIQVMD